MEINKASPDVLLRIPGIGPIGVKKILNARKYTTINFEMLKKMRIALNRAQYFITCNGKMLHSFNLEKIALRNRLVSFEEKDTADIIAEEKGYKQMNLFSDFNFA